MSRTVHSRLTFTLFWVCFLLISDGQSQKTFSVTTAFKFEPETDSHTEDISTINKTKQNQAKSLPSPLLPTEFGQNPAGRLIYKNFLISLALLAKAKANPILSGLKDLTWDKSSKYLGIFCQEAQLLKKVPSLLKRHIPSQLTTTFKNYSCTLTLDSVGQEEAGRCLMR